MEGDCDDDDADDENVLILQF